MASLCPVRVCVLACGPVLAAAALAAQDPASGERPADIEEYLERCAAHGWSGTALVVHRGKTVLHRGYGLADRERGVAHDEDTLFEIASLTKPITAMAVLALAEDGEVDLDASIADYLPGRRFEHTSPHARLPYSPPCTQP